MAQRRAQQLSEARAAVALLGDLEELAYPVVELDVNHVATGDNLVLLRRQQLGDARVGCRIVVNVIEHLGQKDLLVEAVALDEHKFEGRHLKHVAHERELGQQEVLDVVERRVGERAQPLKHEVGFCTDWCGAADLHTRA